MPNLIGNSMIYLHDDYRKILQERLAERQSRNPGYSMRAFARDLKVSPSLLSEVLAGRHHLSAAKSIVVAEALGLRGDERSFFSDLVTAQTAKGSKRREEAEARLLRYKFADATSRLDLDVFKLISDWYHFAIIELLKTRGVSHTAASMARALDIDRETASKALSRLCRLDFLQKTKNRYRIRKGRTETSTSTPSESIRKFHRSILERAIDSLYFQKMDERNVNSVVMAVKDKNLKQARDEMDDFLVGFANKYACQKSADSVYCLAMQLFRLSQRP